MFSFNFSFLRVLVEVFPLPLLVRLQWGFNMFEPFLQQVSVAGDAVVDQKIEGNIPIVELIQPLATLTFPRSPVNNARCQGALFRPSISRVCFFIIHECLELSMKHQRFSITLHILVFLWRIHSLQPPDLFYSHHSCLQGRHHQNLLRGTATKR